MMCGLINHKLMIRTKKQQENSYADYMFDTLPQKTFLQYYATDKNSQLKQRKTRNMHQ